LFIFSHTLNSLIDAIIILVIFTYFTQVRNYFIMFSLKIYIYTFFSFRSSPCIIPLIAPENMGVSGLISDGGSIGGVIFSVVFKVYGSNTPMPFTVLGITVMIISFTIFFIIINGLN